MSYKYLPGQGFVPMKDIVPAGSKGIARVEHYSVSREESLFTRIRSIAHPGEYVREGDYCKLYVGRSLMMSDTQTERRTNYGVVTQATGDVLIAGLGIGLILVPILADPEVKSVTVVEKYRDVIDLVEPPLRKLKGGKKLQVVEADIFTWEPPAGKKWDCIYFDIWPTICTENLAEMEKLHRRYARRKTSRYAWMDSWERATLKRRKAQGQRVGW